MSTNATALAVPIYFETSWSILSSIGLYNVLIGFLVVGMTNLSPVTMVPIVISAANAIADGLCYFAYYADYPTGPTAAAAVAADFFWLIQEAGLSFYSYQILVRILRGKDKTIFMALYWSLISIITLFRTLIAVSRIQDILGNSTAKTDFIDHMHIGYFTTIALVEALSAFFLLRLFFAAKAGSAEVHSKVSLFHYLTRSTEIRLAALTLIGISRAITYSFQTDAQAATSTTGQLDRFVTTLECLFPIVMFIDILAAKSIGRRDPSNESHARTLDGSSKNKSKRNFGPGSTQGVYSMNNMETRVDANGLSSSQERIVAPNGQRGQGDEWSDVDTKQMGINKTVEFVIHDSDSPV